MGVDNCCVRSKQGQTSEEVNQNTIPLRSNPNIQQNNSNNSEEEWGNIRGKNSCSSKKSKISNNDVKKDLTKNGQIKYPKGGFYMKIKIETLAVNYKYIEEFGTTLKPRLEITIDNYKNSFFSTENEPLNNSGDSEIRELSLNNFPINNQNEKRNSRDSVFLPIEKFFQINDELEYFLEEKQIYSLLQFKLINESCYPDLNLSDIQMGIFKIPLNVIYLEPQNCFDGYLTIKYKQTEEIAYLKTKIEFSERSLKGISISSYLQDDSTELSFIEPNGYRSFDNLIINYFYLSPLILESFFFNEKTRILKDSQMHLALEFVNEKEIEEEKLIKYFSISIQQENYILIYEIFNKISTICELKEYEIINKFYEKIHSEMYQDFINISEFTDYNPFITKHFLFFILFLNKNLNKGYKGNKGIKVQSQIPYQNIIQIIYSIVKKFAEFIKTTNNLHHLHEMKDCIHISLSIFNEFLTINSSPYSDIKNYTAVYNNAIILSSYRIILFRLIEQFMDDSEIQNDLFKLFRKMTQIISCTENDLLDNVKTNGSPKELRKQFKLLMIEKYEGLFFNSLSLVMNKYQHYPKLHYNILLIIFHIIKDLDSNIIKSAIKMLGTKTLIDNFNIYRGRIKNFNKMINSVHLNILSVFSEMKIFGNSSPKMINFLDILEDLKGYYDDSPDNHQIYKEFIMAKYKEPEIHQFLTRIFVNLSHTSEFSDFLIIEEKILDDFLNFIEKNEMFHDINERDKLRINDHQWDVYNDDPKNISLKILENTFEGIRNLIVNSNNKNINTFIKFIEKKYESRSNFIKVLEKCNINSSKNVQKIVISLYEEMKRKFNF